MGVEIRNIVKSFNYAFSLLQRENTPVQKLLENTEKECLIFVYMRIMYKHTHSLSPSQTVRALIYNKIYSYQIAASYLFYRITFFHFKR